MEQYLKEHGLLGVQEAVEVEKEMQQIKEQAIKDGTFMKAPNGQPTNLNERQWLQVRTKAFKNWFGDWQNDPENASKVVDNNGEPEVAYSARKEENEGIWTQRLKGYYATFNKSTVQSYADTIEGSKIYEVFLNIRNPKYISPDSIIEIDGRQKYATSVMSIIWSEEEKQALMGDSDGAILTDGKSIVVFDLNQIKSATDNNGEFSTTNPDIQAFYKENSLNSQNEREQRKQQALTAGGRVLAQLLQSYQERERSSDG